MRELVFAGQAVRELYNHAKQCKCWVKSIFSKKPYPCLCLTRDMGIHLTSGGIPRLLTGSANNRLKMVYARGCDPYCDAGWWNVSCRLAGSAAFVEHIDLELFSGLDSPDVKVVIFELCDDSSLFVHLIKAKKEPKPRGRPRKNPVITEPQPASPLQVVRELDL